MPQDFQCTQCGSKSVVLPDILAEDAQVVCCNCGALIGTLHQYRQAVTRQGSLFSDAAKLTGC